MGDTFRQCNNGNKLRNIIKNGARDRREYKSNARAKELPIPPDPEITRMEFDMKDQLVRQTIMTTQEDVIEIKEDLKNIERKIDELK